MVPNRILVKDGGFATQLSVHVGAKVDGDPLWSARFNATSPASVIKTHYDFLQAYLLTDGADIILTNTYQASVEGHMEYLGLDEEQSVELIKTTVRYAHVARQKFLEEANRSLEDGLPMIIASIGPYGAHLHDGSEYSGSYADKVTPEVIRKWHRTRIDACLEAGVDALAIETIPCQMEAEALVDLLCDEYPDVKFWISFQCKNSVQIAHGEEFKDACLAIWEKLRSRGALDNFLAFGVNCLNPTYVSPLFTSLNGSRADSDKLPLVVYPNSGETYDVQSGWTGKEDCVPLEHYVAEWVRLGVKIVGGCCRTYARDVRRIKTCVDELNAKIAAK